MKLPNNIETNILLLSNSPLDEFIGLSPTEIHHLIYDTFGDISPIQFRENIDNEALDQIPLFRKANNVS